MTPSGVFYVTQSAPAGDARVSVTTGVGDEEPVAVLSPGRGVLR